MTKLNKGTFVRKVADRARFTYGDVYTILDTMIEVFEESASQKDEINIRGFGKLYYQELPERKGSPLVTTKGEKLPPATRVIFRLAKNIRDILKFD